MAHFFEMEARKDEVPSWGENLGRKHEAVAKKTENSGGLDGESFFFGIHHVGHGSGFTDWYLLAASDIADIAVVESFQVVRNFFTRTQDASDSLPLEVGLFRWRPK